MGGHLGLHRARTRIRRPQSEAARAREDHGDADAAQHWWTEAGRRSMTFGRTRCEWLSASELVYTDQTRTYFNRPPPRELTQLPTPTPQRSTSNSSCGAAAAYIFVPPPFGPRSPAVSNRACLWLRLQNSRLGGRALTPHPRGRARWCPAFPAIPYERAVSSSD